MDSVNSKYKKQPLSRTRKRSRGSRALRARHAKARLFERNVLALDLGMDCDGEASYLRSTNVATTTNASTVLFEEISKASDSSLDELVVLKPQRTYCRKSNDPKTFKPEIKYCRKSELKNNLDTLISYDQNAEPDIIIDTIKTEMDDPLIIDQGQIATATETNHLVYKEELSSQDSDIHARSNIELHLLKVESQDETNSSETKEDSFDHFGRFIASLLREKSLERAAKLQSDIVSLILMPEITS